RLCRIARTLLPIEPSSRVELGTPASHEPPHSLTSPAILDGVGCTQGSRMVQTGYMIRLTSVSPLGAFYKPETTIVVPLPSQRLSLSTPAHNPPACVAETLSSGREDRADRRPPPGSAPEKMGDRTPTAGRAEDRLEYVSRRDRRQRRNEWLAVPIQWQKRETHRKTPLGRACSSWIMRAWQ